MRHPKGVGAWLSVWLYDNAVPDPEPCPMNSPKRCQYKYAKSRYRVRNGVGAWLGVGDRAPFPWAGSCNFAAGGHSKQRHSVENLAANLHFYPLPF